MRSHQNLLFDAYLGIRLDFDDGYLNILTVGRSLIALHSKVICLLGSFAS